MAAGVAAAASSMASRVAVPRNFSISTVKTRCEAYPFSRFASSAPPIRLSRPSMVVCARRGKKSPPAAQNQPSKKTKKSVPADEEDMSEDAFEKLFSLLEEDLKKDGLSGDDFDDDEISAEELEELERELAAALAGEDDDDDDDEEEEEDDDSDSPDSSDFDSEDEEDLSLPKLKNWQLRRLAVALQTGRRKTNIKALSAELGLERAVVLQFLREPPPNLLLAAAALPEKKKAEEPPPEPVEQDAEEEAAPPPAESPAGSEPVHVMKARWSASKRMKKVQLETLERVYGRTRRPTNAMISSIVHTTNLPRKKVVQWFEDKRGEDGEPQRRRAFRRSDQDSVFS